MKLIKSIFQPLNIDRKVAVITIASTLLLLVFSYHNITPSTEINQTVLFFVIPLLFIVLVFRESPRDYGLALGDWRAGLVITLGGIVLMTPVIWSLAKLDPTSQSYYQGMTASLPWNTFFQIFGWEFLFRGWITFGYARKFGANALWIQAVPFALMHIGKPEIETLSTVFGGFAFGWIAYRTRSFLYPFLIHWYIFTLIVLVASGTLG
ncbi:MAG: CPBP family intramembrane metalloprotease [Anaerolineales bacterium]|nr:CPBP family intramembrane metalloprotease [Anaerolineales bacterium]